MMTRSQTCDNQTKSFPRGGNSKCEGPEKEVKPGGFREHKGPRAEEQLPRGRLVEDEVRKVRRSQISLPCRTGMGVGILF